MSDTRFPYTHACDLIRAWAGYNEKGTKLSRSDASRIRRNIAEILEIHDEELAERLANYYLKNREEISEQSTKEFFAVWKP